MAVVLYTAVLLIVLGMMIGQDSVGQTRPPWQEDLIGPAIVVAELSALSLFAWGLVVWSSSLAWKARLLSWLILMVGLVPLVSFSFILGPLLLTTTPALWRWGPR
ncbi:MAG: hypothetical protein O3A93_08675 [Chloroflexi bacterium]|nr:hypothetical protein [Chloroflexota bacterium]MDA1271319.1 hypothetical protein [Chloroflexota bacterium]PKB58206.1 MAG: hypothetical protein BZY83_08455 [SAR202 cluster bacterium Casp-Chloro-G2]